MRAEFRALCFAKAVVTLKRTKVQQLPRRPNGSPESERAKEGRRRAATAQTDQTTAAATGGRALVAAAGRARALGLSSVRVGPDRIHSHSLPKFKHILPGSNSANLSGMRLFVHYIPAGLNRVCLSINLIIL